jgi:hypothetical protein
MVKTYVTKLKLEFGNIVMLLNSSKSPFSRESKQSFGLPLAKKRYK